MVRRSLATVLLAAVMLLAGAGCGGDSAAAVPPEKTKPVTLRYWGVFTDSDDMDILVAAFEKNHPNIQVEYRKFRPEEYRQKLLEAFAEDKGPDLFTIHNSWLPEYKSKLTPMPAKMSYAVFTRTGSGISEKVEVSLQSRAGLNLKQMRDLFVGVVEQDTMLFVSNTSTEKSIYALPFYVDTLAMYYNKDLLSENLIVEPPRDWGTLLSQAEKNTKPSTREQKEKGITQSVVAMGTGKNVHRAPDILSVLMMQNGATMARQDGRVIFHQAAADQPSDEGTPAARALRFYTDFANPETQAYTWNADLGDALDVFAQGKLAYYFGYSYDAATIKSRNPRLNFQVAEMPNFGKPMNVANYWMEAVSAKSKLKDEAWLFVLETATNKDALGTFLKRTKRGAALNELIKVQLDDVEVGVFAKQNLTARSWYRGRNSRAADDILNQMIDDTLGKVLNPPENEDISDVYQNAVNRAAARLNDTL